MLIHNEWLSTTASIHSINFGASPATKTSYFHLGWLEGWHKTFLGWLQGWLKPPHATPVEPPLKQTQLNLIYIGIFAQNIVWFGVRGFTGASLGDFSRL